MKKFILITLAVWFVGSVFAGIIVTVTADSEAMRETGRVEREAGEARRAGAAEAEAVETAAAEATTTTTRPQPRPKPTYTINGVGVPEMSFLVFEDTQRSTNDAITASVAMILTDFDATCNDYAEMLYNASTLTNAVAREHIERAMRWHPLSVGYAWETGRPDGPC